jgi:hypothetical protein
VMMRVAVLMIVTVVMIMVVVMIMIMMIVVMRWRVHGHLPFLARCGAFAVASAGSSQCS